MTELEPGTSAERSIGEKSGLVTFSYLFVLPLPRVVRKCGQLIHTPEDCFHAAPIFVDGAAVPELPAELRCPHPCSGEAGDSAAYLSPGRPGPGSIRRSIAPACHPLRPPGVGIVAFSRPWSERLNCSPAWSRAVHLGQSRHECDACRCCCNPPEPPVIAPVLRCLRPLLHCRGGSGCVVVVQLEVARDGDGQHRVLSHGFLPPCLPLLSWSFLLWSSPACQVSFIWSGEVVSLRSRLISPVRRWLGCLLGIVLSCGWTIIQLPVC